MKNISLNYPCPDCGSITEEINEGLTVGAKCTKCGWSVATTYIPPIMQDQTLYTVNIQNGDHKNENHIKIISKIAGVNFLQARTLLQKEKSIIFKGKALEIKKIKLILEKLNIVTDIEPKFHW